MAAAVFREWFLEGKNNSSTLGAFITNPRSNVKSSDIQTTTLYIGMEHLEKKHLAVYRHGLGGNVNSNKTKFSSGDILFGKLRPYFHKIGIPNFNGVCSTDILIFKPKEERYYFFALFCIHNEDFINYCTQSSEGTRMPRVNFSTIRNYSVPDPKEKTLLRFDVFARKVLSKVQQNVLQMNSLSITRDLLLPKLMSGQVKVRSDG